LESEREKYSIGSMMNYTCRALSDDDVDLLKKLLTVFAVAIEDHAAYQSRVPTDAYLARLLR
jgi:hypothetical protein